MNIFCLCVYIYSIHIDKCTRLVYNLTHIDVEGDSHDESIY